MPWGTTVDMGVSLFSTGEHKLCLCFIQDFHMFQMFTILGTIHGFPIKPYNLNSEWTHLKINQKQKLFTNRQIHLKLYFLNDMAWEKPFNTETRPWYLLYLLTRIRYLGHAYKITSCSKLWVVTIYPCPRCLLQGNKVFNPLRAKFFNINIYLYFVSFLHIDRTQVVEIFPQVRQEPTYST